MAWSAPSLLNTSADAVPAAFKTIPSITAAVNTLVIVSGRITSGGGGLTGLTVNDTSVNAWNVFTAGTGSVQEFILSTVIAAGKALSGGSVTITRTGTTNITSHALEIVAYTGSVTTSWEDTAVRAFASGSGYSPTITGGTPASSGDLVITALGYRNGDVFSFTNSTGWATAGTAQSDTSPNARDWSAQSYIVNAGSSSLTNTPTVSGGAPGGDSWVMMQTAFIAGGGSPDVTVSLTGSSATVTPGSLDKGNLITLGLTGSVATATAGNVSAGADKTIALTGSAATASPGSLTSGTAAALSGAAATASPGSVANDNLLTLGLSGSGVSTVAGTISVAGDKTIALVGERITALAGSLSASVPLIDAGLPLTHREAERLRQQAKRRDEQIEAAWAARKAERQELQDQLWRAARKGNFDGADRAQAAIAPNDDGEDDDIEFLLLYA